MKIARVGLKAGATLVQIARSIHLSYVNKSAFEKKGKRAVIVDDPNRETTPPLRETRCAFTPLFNGKRQCYEPKTGQQRTQLGSA